MSTSEADAVSRALGQDPLLIGLHDLTTTPDPHRTIDHFVERALSRAALVEGYVPLAAYKKALILLGKSMLLRKDIEPTWDSVSSWDSLAGTPLTLLSQLARIGELIRFRGTSECQNTSFRHDQIRDWFLTRSMAALLHDDELTNDVIGDPYYADTIGSVLARNSPPQSFVRRVESRNPLSLFFALRLIGQNANANPSRILDAINRWTADPATHYPHNRHLRSEAVRVLAETDSREVPPVDPRTPITRVGRFVGVP